MAYFSDIILTYNAFPVGHIIPITDVLAVPDCWPMQQYNCTSVIVTGEPAEMMDVVVAAQTLADLQFYSVTHSTCSRFCARSTTQDSFDTTSSSNLRHLCTSFTRPIQLRLIYLSGVSLNKEVYQPDQAETRPTSVHDSSYCSITAYFAGKHQGSWAH